MSGVIRGTCHALFAHDLALAINLDEAERILAPRPESTEQREGIRGTRRSPRYFQFKPSPLRITTAASPLDIGAHKTAHAVDAVLYDFGAVSITYSIPFECPLQNLLHLSNALYDNATLLADARTRAERLAHTISSALKRPHLSPLVEDYVIFHFELPAVSAAKGDSHHSPSSFIEEHRALLAQILRAESGQLSPQEIDEATASRTSYGPSDAAIVDWNGAILLDPDPQDAHMALEFANVELLEMRHLDDRLDAALDEAYDVLERDARAKGSTRWRPFSRPFTANLRRVSQLQMESALLFEGVNNAIKLLGDQYLARVYRYAAQRLHLPEWDASILRKLATLESIYEKLSDRQTNRRMETLEWIIIALIAFEIAMSVVDRVRG
jgi:hypothetical protein